MLRWRGRDWGLAFIVKTKQKWQTLLLLSVCVLIPVVGPIVVMGYSYRRSAGERAGIPAADFDFSDFGEPLQAGLWPFVSGRGADRGEASALPALRSLPGARRRADPGASGAAGGPDETGPASAPLPGPPPPPAAL